MIIIVLVVNPKRDNWVSIKKKNCDWLGLKSYNDAAQRIQI